MADLSIPKRPEENEVNTKETRNVCASLPIRIKVEELHTPRFMLMRVCEGEHLKMQSVHLYSLIFYTLLNFCTLLWFCGHGEREGASQTKVPQDKDNTNHMRPGVQGRQQKNILIQLTSTQCARVCINWRGAEKSFTLKIYHFEIEFYGCELVLYVHVSLQRALITLLSAHCLDIIQLNGLIYISVWFRMAWMP